MAKKTAGFVQFAVSGSNGALLKSLETLVDAASFSIADKQRLLGFVQAQQSSGSGADADEADAELGAPAAAVYETHSANILDVLQDLKMKAEEQLSELRKAEVNGKHNYEMLKQPLPGNCCPTDDGITLRCCA